MIYVWPLMSISGVFLFFLRLILSLLSIFELLRNLQLFGTQFTTAVTDAVIVFVYEIDAGYVIVWPILLLLTTISAAWEWIVRAVDRPELLWRELAIAMTFAYFCLLIKTLEVPPRKLEILTDGISLKYVGFCHSFLVDIVHWFVIIKFTSCVECLFGWVLQ